MPFPNPLTLTKPRLILASVVVLVLALAGYGLTMVSGITRRLEAGTYTIEVTTNALAHSSGSFDVSLQGEPPAPTAIPTPTLTP